LHGRRRGWTARLVRSRSRAAGSTAGTLANRTLLTEILLNDDALGRARPRERQRDRNWDRQKALALRQGRRRELDEFHWPRRQKIDRRRRRRRIIRRVEHDDGPVDDFIFDRRRRRQTAEIINVKTRRRLERRRQDRKPAAGVPKMRPMRVAAHIAPIGVRHIRLDCPPPAQSLAPRREQSAHPARHPVIRIGDEEFLIAAIVSRSIAAA